VLLVFESRANIEAKFCTFWPASCEN